MNPAATPRPWTCLAVLVIVAGCGELGRPAAAGGDRRAATEQRRARGDGRGCPGGHPDPPGQRGGRRPREGGRLDVRVDPSDHPDDPRRGHRQRGAAGGAGVGAVRRRPRHGPGRRPRLALRMAERRRRGVVLRRLRRGEAPPLQAPSARADRPRHARGATAPRRADGEAAAPRPASHARRRRPPGGRFPAATAERPGEARPVDAGAEHRRRPAARAGRHAPALGHGDPPVGERRAAVGGARTEGR